MKVVAPGKLILSGEHAVVYGNPALAMAVNRYVRASITRERAPQILFDLANLPHRSHLSFSALKELKQRIKRKYHGFLRGDYGIRDVLQKPFELAQFALGMFAESLNVVIPHGVKIKVDSDIPIGCGMGSSATTIVSVIYAISNYLNIPLTQEALFKLALDAENMQHGHSSGLDLHVALLGGCILLKGDRLERRAVPVLPMYFVNTGTPLTTTGECVTKVIPHFQSQSLLNDFAAVTYAMDKALQACHWQDFSALIRQNHRLLIQIGVVPQKVQSFIEQIEQIEGAAKICGAGAVAGDNGGAVLITTDNSEAAASICARFGYHLIPIKGETRGIYVV